MLPDLAVVESWDLPLTSTEGDTSGGGGAVLPAMAALASGTKQLSEAIRMAMGPKPAWREIPDILSWIQYFGVYICVMASK